MLRVDRSTIPTVPMPSLASPYLVRQSLSVALGTPVSLSVRKGLRVVLRPSPAFQLQSILLCLLATMSGVLLLLHPAAVKTVPLATTSSQEQASVPPVQATALPVAGLSAPSPSLAYGVVLGRIQIARLHVSAVVREGADKDILQAAVGHVPGTGVAEQPGNFALAGHRETLFSSLQVIRPGDNITFQTERNAYLYRVFSTRIVKETDTSVLKSNGGFAPKAPLAAHEHNGRLLTLITCYPFVSSEKATERFIVQADLQSILAFADAPHTLPKVMSVKPGKRLSMVPVREEKARKALSVAHRRSRLRRWVEAAKLVRKK